MSVLPTRTAAYTRSVALSISLITANIAAWGWAWTQLDSNPVLLGAALLAYVFGLRHAVDADHIAAIDNATRKLIETGQPAATTGLWFSLGHASVVVLAALAIAMAAANLQSDLAPFKPAVRAAATTVSTVSLLALAIANGLVVVSISRLIRATRSGKAPSSTELAGLLAQRGVLGRVLRGIFRLISRSWHMYPLGFLFGLGFDTATEIAVLAVSAAQASNGLPLASVMVFPALFAAGMALVDTLDGLLMVGVYRWASAEPLRKLYYNLAVTLISVALALVIGGAQLIELIGGETSEVSRSIMPLNENSAAIGAAIAVLFAASWLISARVWRARAAHDNAR